MALTYDQLRQEVLSLPTEEREKLLASLSETVEAGPESQQGVIFGLHPDWPGELRYRMEEYRAGRMEALPWETVEKDLETTFLEVKNPGCRAC